MRGYPDRYAIVDTETDTGPASRAGWSSEQRFRLGVAKFRDRVATGDDTPRYLEFTDPAEFFDAIDAMPLSKEKIYIFAHNVGFDVRILGWFRHVTSGRYLMKPPEGTPESGRYKSPLATFDALPIIMRFFRRDGQQIVISDSMNWLDVALRRVGEWVGMDKGQMPRRDDPIDKWIEYCRLDVDILDAAMRRLWGWCQHNRWPDWDLTPASQAMRVYRMRYARKRPVRPAEPSDLSLDRVGYYGGMTECYRVGRFDRKLYSIDVNSLYPSVMVDRPYPCEVVAVNRKQRKWAWNCQIDPRFCTAEVYLDSPDIPWPVRYNDCTLWMTGKVRTVLPGPEFDLAVQSGVVRAIGRWVEYRTDDLFTPYVNDLWRQRRRARDNQDGVIDHACKRMLNGLHGKFGQKAGDWEYVGQLHPGGHYCHGKIVGKDVTHDTDFRALDGHTYVRVLDAERDDGFVPIASWCTSYARLQMRYLIEIAGTSEVLYQCVDSLVVTGDGLGRLQLAGVVDTGQLGHFKIVDSYDWIDIHTINHITTSSGSKHSGIKRGSAEISPCVFDVEEWEGLADGLFAGRVDAVANRHTIVRTPQSYHRRRVLEDRTTIPWQIDDWATPPEVRLSTRSPLRTP